MTTTTPDTAPVFDSAEGLSVEGREGLHDLLLACADTKLLLGYHYGEWTFGTPELEAAVASCSLAQSELGHVRLLHAVLRKHFGADPDALVERRASGEFANIDFLDTAVAGWPGFVAMNYVVDLAVTRVLVALRGSAFQPIQRSVEKMIDEERYHAHHGQGWFRTLAGRSDTDREAVAEAVHRAVASVAVWFGPPDDPGDRALVAAGVKATSNAELFQAFLGDLAPVANHVGVTITAPPPSAWADWRPRTRRIDSPGPDEVMLYRLRGSKNAIFKLT